MTEFKDQPSLIAVYAEVPERDSKFLELYRRLVASLPLTELASLANAAQIGSLSSAFARACRALQFGNESEKILASEWITGGRPNLRQLKSVMGIDYRIESDIEAVNVFSELLGLAGTSGRRIVVMLDEFQRVGHLGERAREILLSHFRSLFSHHSSYFSLVLAVASRIEKTAIELLPPELKTIMGMRPSVSLPEMNEREATHFVLCRLAWFRPSGYAGPPEAPFTANQIEFVINYLLAGQKTRIIPRLLLQVFGLIYDEISLESDVLDMDRLREMLDGLNWGD